VSGEAAELAARPRRVVKAPAVRRAQLIDCAQSLFLAKGYERTTVNDVIQATALSKGAFYHHFRSKEDLLEAIAARFAGQAIEHAEVVQADKRLTALQRLNMLLATTREWKAENLAELRAMFTVLLRPENGALYHRIVGAVFTALAPKLAEIIAEGQGEGVFQVVDAGLAAEVLLWLGEGRRAAVIDALEVAESGDVEQATTVLLARIRAEEATIDRVLGLAPGGIQLAGSEAYLRSVLADWSAGPRGARTGSKV
jgi:AcrR family transcriptional regulator